MDAGGGGACRPFLDPTDLFKKFIKQVYDGVRVVEVSIAMVGFQQEDQGVTDRKNLAICLSITVTCLRVPVICFRNSVNGNARYYPALLKVVEV